MKMFHVSQPHITEPATYSPGTFVSNVAGS